MSDGHVLMLIALWLFAEGGIPLLTDGRIRGPGFRVARWWVGLIVGAPPDRPGHRPDPASAPSHPAPPPSGSQVRKFHTGGLVDPDQVADIRRHR